MPRLLLKRPHTHAGTSLRPGDPIEIDDATAEWLIAHGIADLEPEPQKADPEPKPIQRKEPKQ